MGIKVLALVQEGRVSGVSLKVIQIHHGKVGLALAVRSLPDAFNLRAGLVGELGYGHLQNFSPRKARSG